MWNRSGTRSSALERAMAQLSGRRVSGKTNVKRNEFQEYVDALSMKTGALQPRQSAVKNFSDISSDESKTDDQDGMPDTSDSRYIKEEPAVGPVSRFLKKAPPRDNLSPALSKSDTRRSVSMWQNRSQSAALSRLALIEDRIKNRRQAASAPAPGRQAPGEAAVMSPQSGEDLGVGGSHFLKKRTAADSPQQEPRIVPARSDPPSHVRLINEGASLGSDEEDMKNLPGGSPYSGGSLLKESRSVSQKDIGALGKKTFIKSSTKLQAATPSSIKDKLSSPSTSSMGLQELSSTHFHPQRSPSHSVKSVESSLSPTPPATHSPERIMSRKIKFSRPSTSSASAHSDIRSLEELFVQGPSCSDSISERTTASEEFRINVMSLDDLVPDLGRPETNREEKTEVVQKVAKDGGPPSHSRDVRDSGETKNEDEIQPAEADYESDFESEIRTESDGYVCDAPELHGDSDMSPVSKGQVANQSEGHRSFQPSGIESVQSESQRYRQSSESSNWSSHSRSDSRSGSITPPQNKGRNVKEAATQTPSDGTSYPWSAAALGPLTGLSYGEPTPVASHVVGAGALEALTAHSPVVFALNDMLRQQLALTRRFVEASRHLHAFAVQPLEPAEHHYTTLEETKEFIKSRRTPKLTMEEALEEVLQEMRDYHYL